MERPGVCTLSGTGRGCLAAPQVTYIMHDLRQNGLQVGNDVTTVEEAADEIMRYFRGKHPEETKL